MVSSVGAVTHSRKMGVGDAFFTPSQERADSHHRVCALGMNDVSALSKVRRSRWDHIEILAMQHTNSMLLNRNAH